MLVRVEGWYVLSPVRRFRVPRRPARVFLFPAERVVTVNAEMAPDGSRHWQVELENDGVIEISEEDARKLITELLWEVPLWEEIAPKGREDDPTGEVIADMMVEALEQQRRETRDE